MKVLNKYIAQFKNAKVLKTENYRFLNASLWNIIGTGSARFILLVTSVLVARIIGVEDYGKWGIIRSTISMFTVLLGFGLSSTSLKYIAEFRKTDKNKVTRIISLSLVIAVITGILLTIILFFSSPLLANNIINDVNLTLPLKITAFFLILIALNSFLTGAIGGFEKFKYIAVSNLFSCVLGGPIIVLLALKYNIVGLAFGYIIYYFLYAVALYYFLKKTLKTLSIKISLRNLKEEIDTFKNFSTPAIISSSIGGPAIWLAFAFVTRQEGGFIILGLYNAAKIAQNIIIELGSQIHAPLISILSNTKNSNTMTTASFIIPWLFISIFVVPIIYIPEMISWMFNKGGYLTAEFNYVISITLFTTYVMLFKQGINRITVTKNLMWWGVYENIFWVIILLALAVILVPAYGATGLALAFMFSYFLDLIAISPFYLNKKLIPSKIILSKEAAICWASAITGLLLIFFNVSILNRTMILIFASISNIYFLNMLRKKISL